MNKPIHIFLLILFVLKSSGQDTVGYNDAFVMEIEIRPRAEFKNNYRLNIEDSYDSEFYVSQRNRISATYNRKRLTAHVSIQEIHLWGKDGNPSLIGSINVFEAYIESSIINGLFFRVGRQAISLDNGRIFSSAPWSQQCQAHEGLRLMYHKNHLKTDFVVAATRPYLTYFNPAYSPVASHTYKLLLVHWLHYKINRQWILTTINTTDAFEDIQRKSIWRSRATSGGRIEFSDKEMGASISGYYQYGQTPTGRKISAYYLHPEISYKVLDMITFRIGAEILSGSNEDKNHVAHRSFSPLYGVARKFMGNMNFFTRFPADVNGRGLVNPYIFIIFRPYKNISLRADGHLFYTQYHLHDINIDKLNRYLGFENDLSLNYKPIRYIDVTFGFSYFIAEETMKSLGKIESVNNMLVWSYLMVSFNLEVLKYKR